MSDPVGSEDRVWGEELPPQEVVPQDLPPQYSQGESSTSTGSTSRPFVFPPQHPILPFHKYCLKNSVLSDDESTTTIKDARYTKDAPALGRMLIEQAALPPRPLVRVRGWHLRDSMNGQIEDFSMWMTLTAMIWRDPDKDPLNYVRLSQKLPVRSTEGRRYPQEKGGTSTSVRATDMTLEELAERFCKDPSTLKRIILTRKVVNWDTEYISGALRNMIASAPINYRGNIEIDFPIQHSTIIYQVGEPSVIDGFKRFLSNLSTVGQGKENDSTGFKDYNFIESIWPYATLSADEVVDSSHPRQFAVASEAAFWQLWKPAFRNGVLSRMKGCMGIDDWIATEMGRHVPDRIGPWGVRY